MSNFRAFLRRRKNSTRKRPNANRYNSKFSGWRGFRRLFRKLRPLVGDKIPNGREKPSRIDKYIGRVWDNGKCHVGNGGIIAPGRPLSIFSYDLQQTVRRYGFFLLFNCIFWKYPPIFGRGGTHRIFTISPDAVVQVPGAARRIVLQSNIPQKSNCAQ